MAKARKRTAPASDEDDTAQLDRRASPENYKLNSRSCRSCHQRKIRCDRGDPCKNCRRSGLDCEYPTKDKDVVRRTTALQHISDRLERLEVLLSRLVEDDQAITEFSRDRGSDFTQKQIQAPLVAHVKAKRTVDEGSSKSRPSESTWQLLLNDEQVLQSGNDSAADMLRQVERKVSNNQIDDPPTSLAQLQKTTKAGRSLSSAPQSSACGSSIIVSDLLELYPDPRLALRLWNIYVKSVDPVLKILHIPSIQSNVVSTILEPKAAPPSLLALAFAIYFAAVTAVCYGDEDDGVIPDWEAEALLQSFKVALDRLLVVTDLMNKPEIMAIQALAIYATCLRVHEASRRVWVLNGLAIRVAQSIGIDRDGARFQLSPFDTEMRLRLWWHLCVLESRAPEDQGFEPSIDLTNRGLRLPLNVNDNQLYPEMARLPAEVIGWTEMSFFLIQTESCRLLHPILDVTGQHSANALLDITKKRKVMDERGPYLSDKYGMPSSSATAPDLVRFAHQHTTNARKKLQFVLQLREEISMRKQKGPQDNATPDVLKPSFRMACETLESYYESLKGKSASSFKWFLNMYTQWYALAYVFHCLGCSPFSSGTKRAWFLVEELFPRGMSFDDSSTESSGGHGLASISNCLDVLRSRALASRQRVKQSVASTDVEVKSSSDTLHLHPEIVAHVTPNPTGQGLPTLSGQGHDLTVDFEQGNLPPLDFFMPDIPFLPDSDWNAVINGWVNDDVL